MKIISMQVKFNRPFPQLYQMVQTFILRTNVWSIIPLFIKILTSSSRKQDTNDSLESTFGSFLASEEFAIIASLIAIVAGFLVVLVLFRTSKLASEETKKKINA